MVTFDAVVQDFHVCLTEHLGVEFRGDDVWEHLLAIPMDTSSLTTREFSQSGFSGLLLIKSETSRTHPKPSEPTRNDPNPAKKTT